MGNTFYYGAFGFRRGILDYGFSWTRWMFGIEWYRNANLGWFVSSNFGPWRLTWVGFA